MSYLFVGNAFVGAFIGDESVSGGVEGQSSAVAESAGVEVTLGESCSTVEGFIYRCGAGQVVHAGVDVIGIGGIDSEAGFALGTSLVGDVHAGANDDLSFMSLHLILGAATESW